MPQPTFTTRVLSVRDVAPAVREIVLAPPEQPVSFQAGQWISLQLPVGEHPPLVRAYSFAAPPAPSGELVLCLDRVPDGLGSTFLFGLRPGDEVSCGAVLGNFVLPEGDGDLLWLAYFTGIVPFRAMLGALRQERSRRPVTLVYGAATAAELAYADELTVAAAECEWFRLITTIDSPEAGWNGPVGPVLDQLPGLLKGRSGQPVPMVCGKREFVRPIRDHFAGLGYDRKAVKWENYD